MISNIRRRLIAEDTGSAALFFAVLAPALLVICGLVVDGGGKIWAKQRASTAASEAARAGGQAIVGSTAIRGQTPTIDSAAAVSAARNYLRAAGVTGTATITGGQTLTVTATASHQPLFLSMIGIGEMTVNSSSSARLARGIRTEGN